MTTTTPPSTMPTDTKNSLQPARPPTELTEHTLAICAGTTAVRDQRPTTNDDFQTKHKLIYLSQLANRETGFTSSFLPGRLA
ncbi:hypothetical protein T07_13886 [Trichinella nelsoni]|uniref:Uncharacterized protein n=1 Tax=Trichinella nelsoni TaxID=6336 RepID=A0A0V0SLZ9_9BILA|nr:hypothetical protein T07_13886 [Trichinella nelsoni]